MAIETKNFPLFERFKGFQNFDKLNEMGKAVFALFYYFAKNGERYWTNVNSIWVTSQDRPSDTATSPHYKGKAVDIVIDPPIYMAYYAGLISTIKFFNIYLGTVRKTPNNKTVRNLHIHFDNDYSNKKNTKGYETAAGYRMWNKITVLNTLTLYKFSVLDNIKDFGKFKNDTIKYLTTTYTVKKPIENYSKFDFDKFYLSNMEKGLTTAKTKFMKGAAVIGLGLAGIIIIKKLLKR